MPSFTPPVSTAVDFALAAFTAPASTAVDFEVGAEPVGVVYTQAVGTTNASGVAGTSEATLACDVPQLTRVTRTIDGVLLDTVRVITSR